MKIKEKYKIGFDVWGIILFLLIMIPNFIWFVIPAPNDILKIESATPIIDTVASVFQVIMVFALCMITNQECKRPMLRHFLASILITTTLYFIGWIFYYIGVTSPVIVMDLIIAPCIAFILFAAGRKNIFAMLSAIIFMICHLIYGIINFIV